VTDAAIKQEAREFCLQETQHYRTHRRFNDVLLARGYAGLAGVEAEMALSYKRLAAQPLGKRLAYAAGFEAMTLGITRWLVTRRLRLFRGADPRITSFILWHMVEETEHKLVAHDVYCALTPGYWQRVAGLLHGTLDVIRWTRRSYVALLEHDGRWRTLRGRLKVWSWALRFISGVTPAILHALVPGHDPRDMAHPGWVDEWIRGYASSGRDMRNDEMPLIDTVSPTMPVPF
jgi:predicted metal-dependent hydrolase